MKPLNNIQRATQYVQMIEKLIVHEIFNDEVPMPTVTIQSTVGALGHFVTVPIWEDGDGKMTYEINLGADYLMRADGILGITVTLIHETTHLYCAVKGIRETSNHGVYHNRLFKQVAEAHMIHIDKLDNTHGFTASSETYPLVSWVVEHDLRDLELTRTGGFALGGLGLGDGNSDNSGATGTPRKKRKPSSTRRYICPCCKMKIRSTKDLTGKLLCIDCNEVMVEVTD